MEKRLWAVIMVLGFVMFVLMACAVKEAKPPDEPAMVDYNIRFVDIDKDNNGVMTMEEFRAYFPHGDEIVFGEADMDGNGMVDHNEWHIFKKISGYPEREGHGEGK